MRYVIFVATALIAPLAVLAEGAPPTAGLCTTCHGEAGPSTFPGVPTIHGLPEVVIENALYDFRGHTRPCRKAPCSAEGSCPDLDMCAVSAPMKHEDMEVLAVWYASQPWMPANDPFDAQLADKGKAIHAELCEICHTAGGADPLDEASILRGQQVQYLRTAIADYRSGQRTAVAAMDLKVKSLTDDQVEALIAYYASPREGAPAAR